MEKGRTSLKWVSNTNRCFLVTDEVDEIEVYGSEAQSGTQLATYSFEVKPPVEGLLTHRLVESD